MSYVRTGMGTETLVRAETAPAPASRAVVPSPAERPSGIELVGRHMALVASYLRPQQVAHVWPFMIPVLAIPSVAGAFGAGDENRWGGAAYGLVAGIVSTIVGYPAAAVALSHIDQRSFALRGLMPLALGAGILSVPAYFAGKRAKGGTR